MSEGDDGTLDSRLRAPPWRVARGIAKLEFYNNLRKSADVSEDDVTTVYPTGYVHLPKIDAEFIQQLCAEQLITRRDRNGFAPCTHWHRGTGVKLPRTLSCQRPR